jgi:paraquat-inducible protein B
MTNPFRQTTDAAKKTWYVWLFPVIALGICGWLLVEYFRQRGPTIKIYFDDASNIQAGKTHVRFRGVTIGMVKHISISSDNKDVIASVDLQSDAAQFAAEGTKFWVVIPKVNFSGVSGLETLFEGTYIAVQPGKPDGHSKVEFRGQLGSDTNEALEYTTAYNLEAPNVESLSAGDAVTFRGINVGSVSKVTLTKTAQAALIQINIQNKYVKLIRNNTIFWKKVGVQAKLGLFGSELKLNSIESILHGGVEFFTPDAPGEVAKAHTKFFLEPAPPKGLGKWNPNLDL